MVHFYTRKGYIFRRELGCVLYRCKAERAPAASQFNDRENHIKQLCTVFHQQLAYCGKILMGQECRRINNSPGSEREINERVCSHLISVCRITIQKRVVGLILEHWTVKVHSEH